MTVRGEKPTNNKGPRKSFACFFLFPKDVKGSTVLILQSKQTPLLSQALQRMRKETEIITFGNKAIGTEFKNHGLKD